MAIEENTVDFDEEVTQWAQDTAVRLIKALDRYKIDVNKRYSQANIDRNHITLRKSIMQEVARNGGSIEKATFRFLAYGRFVDMGVGRGFAKGAKGTAAFKLFRNDNGSLKNKVNRIPKPFYTKTMYKQINRLSGVLLANMSEKVLETMKARMRRIDKHPSNLTI